MGIVVAVLVAALIGMVASWVRRKRRQGDLDLFAPVPSDIGPVLATENGLYLATTPAGDRLNRVAVGGLGFRARLTTVVAETGILLPFPGGRDVFIPASAVRSVGTASWTIDRGIEPAGLTVVGWTLGDTVVDSYFRLDESAAFTSAVRSLLPTATESVATESESQ
jgi:hypothetical protein